jgi:hypothetical protein
MKIVPGLELNDDKLSDAQKDMLAIKRKAERYLQLATSKSKVDAEMKKLKQELLTDWENIPNQFKLVNPNETVTVAGQTFVKKSKYLRFENVIVAMRQRIDTKLSRDGLYAIIKKKRDSASTDEEKKILDDIKGDIDRMLSPHLTDVIEPRKRVKSRKG